MDQADVDRDLSKLTITERRANPFEINKGFGMGVLVSEVHDTVTVALHHYLSSGSGAGRRRPQTFACAPRAIFN